MSTLKALFLILFCGISTMTVAQQYIGIKGGALSSNSDFHFNLDRSPFDANRLRPFVSIFTEFGRNPSYSFVPNIHFIQNGNRTPIDSTSTLRANTNRINYIGTGLMNRFKIFSEEYELYGLAGPQLKLAIGVNSGGQKLDFKEINLKRFDINLRMGFGMSKVNKNYKMIIECVYDFAFFDIDSSSQFNSTNGNAAGLLIGLEFKLKEKEE